ncbi:MAG: ABC transporter ATP-binding protein [Opitutales bacterium]|jgi:putative ABC transport system ATP-binding protein|nr:ABC transporter ATP-binding protein [Opitutales bacterium]
MAFLNIDHLRKSFVSPDGEQVPVVEVREFTMGEGKQLGLRGTSGSGKTTFLHLIAGILRPDEGSISFDGQVVSKTGPHGVEGLSEAERDRLRADSIGYVFQSFNLLQGYNCLENLLLPMAFSDHVDRERAEELLDKVGLGHRVRHFPRQLSIGQQQRVAVARALVNRPKLVLADEPTGNLDPTSAAQALGLLSELCSETKAALLLVSHDHTIVESFDDHLDWRDLNAAFDQVTGKS